MSDIRKRIKAPAPDGWQQLADAVREAGTAVVEAMRDAFGPQQEVRMAVPTKYAGALKEPLLVHMTADEADDPRQVEAAIRLQHPDAFETAGERLRREIRERVLELCGFMDGGETTFDGSMINDLAHERTDAIMDTLEQMRGHGFPQALTPPPEGAPLYMLLNALRPLVYRVVNATADPGAELTDHVDVIMAFVNLAREHPDPKRLLPRGDRLGDWLPPGTPVLVHLGGHDHPAVVEPSRDMVTVRLAGSGVVTEFPWNTITKEGEPWTPPKPTDS